MGANEEELAEAAIEAEIAENANQETIDVEFEVQDRCRKLPNQSNRETLKRT